MFARCLHSCWQVHELIIAVSALPLGSSLVCLLLWTENQWLSKDLPGL